PSVDDAGIAFAFQYHFYGEAGSSNTKQALSDYDRGRIQHWLDEVARGLGEHTAATVVCRYSCLGQQFNSCFFEEAKVHGVIDMIQGIEISPAHGDGTGPGPVCA